MDSSTKKGQNDPEKWYFGPQNGFWFPKNGILGPKMDPWLPKLGNLPKNGIFGPKTDSSTKKESNNLKTALIHPHNVSTPPKSPPTTRDGDPCLQNCSFLTPKTQNCPESTQNGGRAPRWRPPARTAHARFATETACSVA